MSHGRIVESPLGQIVRLAHETTLAQVVGQIKTDGRQIRVTAAASVAGGAAQIVLPPVPVGRFARYYRVAVGGTAPGSAVVSIYSGSVFDINLLDTTTLAAAALGAIFAPGTKSAYEIDPGSSLVVNVTGAGAGEITVNAYYELLTWDPTGERMPTHESPAMPPPDHDTNAVDFYPPETDDLDREGGNQQAPAPLRGNPDWLYPADTQTVIDEINWTGTDN